MARVHTGLVLKPQHNVEQGHAFEDVCGIFGVCRCSLRAKQLPTSAVGVQGVLGLAVPTGCLQVSSGLR